MGGILLGTHYFLQFQFDLQSLVLIHTAKGYGDPVSWLFLLTAFPIAWHFSKTRMNHLTYKKIKYDCLYDVTIGINQIIIHIKGIMDSGNQLQDPISRKPVMIVSTKLMKVELPEEIKKIIESSDTIMTTQLPKEWRDIVRIIPAKTIAHNHQLLCAFKPKFIRIKDHEGKEIYSDGLVVFSNQTLSNDGSYGCILHPQMMTNI